MKTLGFKVLALVGGVWLACGLRPLGAAVDANFNPASAHNIAPQAAAEGLKRELASNAVAEAVEENIKRLRKQDERRVPKCERYGRNPILCCLAIEEQALNDAHFASGPLYKLNTNLIDEIRNIDGLWPTPEAQQAICHNRDFTPSVALLKELLIHGMSIFMADPKRDELDLGAEGLQNASAEALVERTPRIFFDYISALQTQMKLPECLNRKIPALKEFQDKLLDLESEKIDSKLVEPGQVEQIFKHLKKLDKYAQECDAEQEKRMQQQKQAQLRLMRKIF